MVFKQLMLSSLASSKEKEILIHGNAKSRLKKTGLLGSSAIVCAALNCMLDLYKVRHLVMVEKRPNIILDAEKELGIFTGLQDRVAQVYGGLVFMEIFVKYLYELSGTRCYFAMKVMDKASLASRKKLIRAQTEREILQLLDHPFLPTLYTHFETERFTCLVMEYCPGGDLHFLRQRQPGKHFSEYAARFYAAEVLLALEYLHMLAVVYRDHIWKDSFWCIFS